MKTVRIGSKEFVIGLVWETYVDLQRAKDAVRDNIEDGYASGIIPVKDKGIYLVYRGEKVKGRYYILATGFLHKASGAYYLPLSEKTVWLFVKGVDGAVLFDDEVEKEDVKYKALENFGLSEVSLLSQDELYKPVPYATSGKKPYYLIGGVLGLVVLVSFFFLGTGKQEKQISAPSQDIAVQERQQESPPPPPPLQYAPFGFHFDFRKCYEDYYSSDSDKVQCAVFKEAEDYMSCDELRKVSLPFHYGEPRAYDDGVVAYPFSLAGSYYYEDLKMLADWTFAKEGFSFELSGEPRDIRLVWTGAVLCK